MIFIVFGGRASIADLFDGGQILLFSVGFLAPAIAEIRQHKEILEFPHRGILDKAAFGLMIVAVLFFGVVVSNVLAENTGVEELGTRNVWAFRVINMVILAAALVVSYFASAYGYYRDPKMPDPNAGSNELGKEFDAS